jgi:Zn-dependent protease
MDSADHRPCASCERDVPTALLACPYCNALTHAERLKVLAHEADALTQRSDLAGASLRWREALTLLPPDSRQHAQVLGRLDALHANIEQGAHAATKAPERPRRGGLVGALGAFGLVVWKLKSVLLLVLSKAKFLLLGLTKLPTLFSMLVWVGATGSRGWGFALGLVASIYVHEMGHVAALTRHGFSATAPMFIPGFGAFVRLQQQPANAREDARIGLAGPLWGLAAAIVALALSYALASPLLRAIASVGASVNLFNLVPVWQLDGARGLRALSRRQRVIVGAVLFACAAVGDARLVWVVAAVFAWRTYSEPGDADGDRIALRDWLLLVPALTAIASFDLPGRM